MSVLLESSAACSTSLQTVIIALGRQRLSIEQLSCCRVERLNPFRTAVSCWGQLGTNYLVFEWNVPQTGLEFLKG